MKTIAYPGYHDPEDFKQYHLPEMRDRNFDTILFPVCEQTWQFNLANVREMREIAEDAGLDTWAGPWGMCNMFGGEAISTYHPDADGDVFFELWKSDIIGAGFRTVFLDEPRLETNKLVEWYDRQRMTTMPEVRLTTSLDDVTFDDMSDDQLRSLPVDSLGISCYHWTADAGKIMDRTVRWTERLLRLRPRDSHVWIQGFDLPEGAEWVPILTKSLARASGVTDFAHWSFRGTRGTAEKTAANWRKVWDNMGPD